MALSGTLLNAAIATGVGNTIVFDEPKTTFGVQVMTTGSPASFSARLEGSIDGINFEWIGTNFTSAGIQAAASSAIPLIAIRANLTALSGGTSPISLSAAAA
jgi:hypothetical protein